jgi:hypothetical protein
MTGKVGTIKRARHATDNRISPKRKDESRKNKEWGKTNYTFEQRIDFLYRREVAIKTHDVSARDGLLAECAGMPNGEAMVKKIMERLG